MRTYWLYRGDEVLTAVRAPEGSDDNHVRYLAAASHQRIPLSHPRLCAVRVHTRAAQCGGAHLW